MNNILSGNIYNPQLVDLGNELRIYLGVPTKKISLGNLGIEIPRTPHVFTVHRLCFNYDSRTIYEDVVIAIAHGGLKKVDNRYYWIFDDGQLVGDVIDTFNAKSETPVDFIVACSGSYFDPNISMNLTPLETDVSGLEIYGLPNSSSYIIGEQIRINSSVLPKSDIINLTVSCDLSKLRNPNAVLLKESNLELREM